MTAATTSAVSRQRLDALTAIRPRWLFWVVLWFSLISAIYFRDGLALMFASFFALPNRRDIYRSLLHSHRRIFHQPPGLLMHKLILGAPVQIFLGMLFLSNALVILTLCVHLPGRAPGMRALDITVYGALIIMMLYFYNAGRKQTK
jgi:hypothetical protein